MKTATPPVTAEDLGTVGAVTGMDESKVSDR